MIRHILNPKRVFDSQPALQSQMSLCVDLDAPGKGPRIVG
ncbi:MAG: hypothetical protein ACI8PQ_002551 [Planctomycetota bacterium]|jgi:hypothetical protein